MWWLSHIPCAPICAQFGLQGISLFLFVCTGNGGKGLSIFLLHYTVTVQGSLEFHMIDTNGCRRILSASFPLPDISSLPLHVK